jgi:hypothetical protein
VHHEHSLVSAFIKRSKRDRYREFVSNARLRHKFTGQLAHFSDFDAKYRVPLPSNKLFVENITRELHRRHSPNFVFAISEDPSLDQKEIALVEALNAIVGRGMGTVLSCIPGRLAFVETEDERFILERKDLLEKKEYIRFAVGSKDEDNYLGRGVFQAAMLAMEWNEISGSDADELKRIFRWFSENLNKPKSSGRDAHRHGECWFKSEALEHMSKIQEIVRILEGHGIPIKKIKTDKPGYVVYEDEWQLVAEPILKRTLRK